MQGCSASLTAVQCQNLTVLGKVHTGLWELRTVTGGTDAAMCRQRRNCRISEKRADYELYQLCAGRLWTERPCTAIQAESWESARGLVMRCENYGKLSTTIGIAQNHIGGIAGLVYGVNAQVENSVNYATVQGYFCVGGLAGARQSRRRDPFQL